MNRHLHVAVPTHSRAISVPTAVTLLNLQEQLPAPWQMTTHFASATIISDLRNLIVADFLASGRDVLLMIDADQGVPVPVILRMLQSGHPVVGSFYPRRQLFWDQARLSAPPASLEDLHYRIMRFVGTPATDADGEVTATNGFIPARHIGGGCMMIRREALDRLMAAYPELHGMGFPDEDENLPRAPHNWGFFNPIVEHEPRRHLSEDFAFCHRWREGCQGEIWADVLGENTHVGQVEITGSLLKFTEATTRTDPG